MLVTWGCRAHNPDAALTSEDDERAFRPSVTAFPGTGWISGVFDLREVDDDKEDDSDRYFQVYWGAFSDNKAKHSCTEMPYRQITKVSRQGSLAYFRIDQAQGAEELKCMPGGAKSKMGGIMHLGCLVEHLRPLRVEACVFQVKEEDAPADAVASKPIEFKYYDQEAYISACLKDFGPVGPYQCNQKKRGVLPKLVSHPATKSLYFCHERDGKYSLATLVHMNRKTGAFCWYPTEQKESVLNQGDRYDIKDAKVQSGQHVPGVTVREFAETKDLKQIYSLKVEVDILHDDLKDIGIWLEHRSRRGKVRRALLFDGKNINSARSAKKIRNILQSSFTPVNTPALISMMGAVAPGVWSLRIEDRLKHRVGLVKDASISLFSLRDAD